MEAVNSGFYGFIYDLLRLWTELLMSYTDQISLRFLHKKDDLFVGVFSLLLQLANFWEPRDYLAWVAAEMPPLLAL